MRSKRLNGLRHAAEASQRVENAQRTRPARRRAMAARDTRNNRQCGTTERPTATTARRDETRREETQGEDVARRDVACQSPRIRADAAPFSIASASNTTRRADRSRRSYATLRAHKVCRFAPLFSPSERGRTCSRRSPSPDAHVRSHESRGAASPRFFLHLSPLSRPPPCPSCPSCPSHPLARRAIYTCQYSQT